MRCSLCKLAPVEVLMFLRLLTPVGSCDLAQYCFEKSRLFQGLDITGVIFVVACGV